MEIGEARRPTAEAAARERLRTRAKRPASGKLPEAGQARDDIAAAVGMSWRTLAALRLAELDPAAAHGGPGGGSAKSAVADIAKQRRSENRRLLALSEEALRMAELDPARQGERTDLAADAAKFPIPHQRRSENRRLAELDPPTRYKRGGAIAAPAAIAHQRRSENRDLLALSEEAVRMAELDPAVPSDHSRVRGSRSAPADLDIAKQRRSENRDLLAPDCDCPACAALAAAIDADLAARRRVREAAEAVDRHHGLVGRVPR